MYDFLLVINTSLLPILHHFRDIAFVRYIKNRYIWLPLLHLIPPPDGGVAYIISLQVIYR